MGGTPSFEWMDIVTPVQIRTRLALHIRSLFHRDILLNYLVGANCPTTTSPNPLKRGNGQKRESWTRHTSARSDNTAFSARCLAQAVRGGSGRQSYSPDSDVGKLGGLDSPEEAAKSVILTLPLHATVSA